MARSRPALLTLGLSAAAALGYATYRVLVPTPAITPSEAVTEDSAPVAEQRQLADTLPDFSLGNLAGEPQSIRSWPGKPLLINFWATWCGPCLREIPMLKELETQRPDIQVIGVAIDRRDPVEKFAGDMGFNYPILIGQSEAWEAAASLGVDIYALPVHGVCGRGRGHPWRPHGRIARRAPGRIPNRGRRPHGRQDRPPRSPEPHRRPNVGVFRRK